MNIKLKAILAFGFMLGGGLLLSSSSYAIYPYYEEDGYWEDGSGGTATWDASTSTLTLNNYNDATESINIPDSESPSTLKLIGKNTTGQIYYAGGHDTFLTISGGGTLNVPNSYISACRLNIENSTINVSSNGISGGSGDGCEINIKSSTITVNKAISVGDHDGTITISDSVIKTNGNDEQALYAPEIVIKNSSADLKANRYNIRTCSLSVENSIVEITGGESGFGDIDKCEQDTKIKINGGKLSIDQLPEEFKEFYISDGEFSYDDDIDVKIFVMDGGNVNINGELYTAVFVQNDGNISVSASGRDDESAAALLGGMIVFNGGVGNFSSRDVGIGAQEELAEHEDMSSLKSLIQEDYGITLPEEEFGIYFNGGDITMNGGTTTALMLIGRPAVKIADKMLRDPTNLTVDSSLCIDADDDSGHCHDDAYMTVLSDGNPVSYEPIFDGEDMVGMNFTHVLTKAHIYENAITPGVPDTRDINFDSVFATIIFAAIADLSLITALCCKAAINRKNR